MPRAARRRRRHLRGRARDARGQQRGPPVAADHGWETTTWSAAATAMLAYTELLRSAAADAQRLTADALASGVSASPPLRYRTSSTSGTDRGPVGDPHLQSGGGDHRKPPTRRLPAGDAWKPEQQALLMLAEPAPRRLATPGSRRRPAPCPRPGGVVSRTSRSSRNRRGSPPGSRRRSDSPSSGPGF